MTMIEINKRISNIHGMEIITVYVGDFWTKIAHWKDGNKYQLKRQTTPKTLFIDTNKDFDTVEEAVKYYIENLKLSVFGVSAFSFFYY